MQQQKIAVSATILIEDGKLVCGCRANPWIETLKALYAEFRAEDGKPPLKEIIPFDYERVIRFLATNGKRIGDEGFEACGMATLVLCNHGTGARYVGHVEDVFVSKEYRGCGLGEKLMRNLIFEAERRNVMYLELTSSPKRVKAHCLYKKLGFSMIAGAVSRDDVGNRATDLFRLPPCTI